MTSIRLRFIDGLRRAADHISERCVKALGSDDVKPQSSADLDDSRVSKLRYEGAKRQVDDAVRMANLCQDVNKIDPAGLVNNLDIFAAQSKRFAGANNYVVHQNPQGKNHPDLARLNARSAGV